MGVKKQLLSFILISLVLLSSGCKKNPTEPEKIPTLPTPPSLELSVDGVSCTEAWIKVKKLNDTTFLPISVKINEKEFFHGFLAAVDTVLFVESLIPNTTYTVKGIILDTLQTAEELKVTTLPTTSHNFTWQTFEFGEHSSSVLYDVAIVDENNIWAVGAIYMKDSLGNTDPHAYNAVQWDGSKWKVKRIYYYGACSAVEYPPLKAIWAFSDSNIIVTNGGSIGWFDGKKVRLDCGVNPLLTGAINKMWGTSRSDLYAVGNNGNIAYYDGINWQKIESGTTLNINDIWGDFNKRTQEWEVLAVCGNILHGWEQDRTILEIKNGTQAIQLNGKGASWPLSGVWFKATTKNYVVGSGIYYKQKLTDSVWNSHLTSITTYHTNKIRGNDVNDVIIVGAYGEVLHFNGMTWKSYMNETGLTNGTYLAVDIKNDFIITVGYQSAKAVITIGKR